MIKHKKVVLKIYCRQNNFGIIATVTVNKSIVSQNVFLKTFVKLIR